MFLQTHLSFVLDYAEKNRIRIPSIEELAGDDEGDFCDVRDEQAVDATYTSDNLTKPSLASYITTQLMDVDTGEDSWRTGVHDHQQASGMARDSSRVLSLLTHSPRATGTTSVRDPAGFSSAAWRTWHSLSPVFHEHHRD